MPSVKITATDCYIAERKVGMDCPVMDDCQPRYCKKHRVLWMDCETAIKTKDGSGQPWYELQDCPNCVQEERYAKMPAL